MPAPLAICAITYHRPAGLAALLAGIAGLDAPAGADVRVVIVDNDEDASARVVVDEWRPKVPWPIDYAVEPRRGIPHARNRAIALASDRDVIFIDDDEVPEREWLVELLRVRDASRAAIVTGPVIPRFDVEPAPWLTSFFERPRFPDGTEIGYARTSNVFIAREVLRAVDEAFSPEFALTGGCDTHFFMRAVRDGHRIVWADRATVVETMPVSRVRLGWLVRREYRRGNTLSLCLRDLSNTWPARAKRVVRIARDLLVGAALVLSSPVRGHAAQALRGMQRVALAIGMLTGLFGLRYDEYTVIHGS